MPQNNLDSVTTTVDASLTQLVDSLESKVSTLVEALEKRFQQVENVLTTHLATCAWTHLYQAKGVVRPYKRHTLDSANIAGRTGTRLLYLWTN